MLCVVFLILGTVKKMMNAYIIFPSKCVASEMNRYQNKNLKYL